MKILTSLTYYHPHWTGLTTYAQRIAEGLAERGHSVTVLTTQHHRELARREIVGGVEVVRLPPVARVSRAMLMPSFPVVARRLVAEHDLLHVHSPMPEAAFLVALARALHRPSLVTHQGDVVMPSGVLNGAIQGAMNVALGYAIRHADTVATLSADYAEHSRLLESRGRPVLAITPPTTIPEPQPESVATWRHELKLDGRPIVGFGGRFVEEKGFDFLLQAMPAVRAAIPNVHFLFAGETEVVYERFYERCRPMLDANDDAITSVGLILDRQRLADFYSLCDLFVLPSRTDCFAGVQVEALLCGTPLVSADIPGAREVVLTTGMGRLVRPRDPSALARGIIEELLDPRPRPDRASVLSQFDPVESLDRYEQLVTAVVAGRPTEPAPALESAGPGDSRDRWPLSPRDRIVLDHRLRNEPDMAYRRRVPRLMALLDPCDGDTVLDCGSGMGELSTTLAELRSVTVIAVDRDRERLARAARERVPAELASVDAQALPFADATFDRVLAAEVLEHLADDDAGMREIHRVLKPGGTVAISVPHANYPLAWDPLNRTLETFGLPPRRRGAMAGQWSGHVRLYLPAELRDCIEAAGLFVEALEQHTTHATLLNPLLVYGIGKQLVERNLLPERWRRSVNRFHPDDGGGDLNPIAVGARVLRRLDRRNDVMTGDEGRFVGIVARATKPPTVG